MTIIALLTHLWHHIKHSYDLHASDFNQFMSAYNNQANCFLFPLSKFKVQVRFFKLHLLGGRFPLNEEEECNTKHS